MSYKRREDGMYVDEQGNVIGEDEYQKLGFGPNGKELLSGEGGGDDFYNNPPGAEDPIDIGGGVGSLVDNGDPVTGAPPNDDGGPSFDAFAEGFNSMANEMNTPYSRTGKDPNTELDTRGATGSFSETETDSGAVTIDEENVNSVGTEDSSVNKTGTVTNEGTETNQTDGNTVTNSNENTVVDTNETTLSKEQSEFENQGLSEFNKEAATYFDSDEQFQNWQNEVAQNWTDEQKQTWLQNQQQGWTNEERQAWEENVRQTNAAGTENTVGGKQGVVETDIKDDYNFGEFLRNLADRDADELGRKNDRLSALSNGGNIRGQVAAAVREAVSGPAAQGAGSSARARVGSRAAAEVGDKIFNDRVAAAAAMEGGGDRAIGAAQAARQFADQTQTSDEAYQEDKATTDVVDETGGSTSGEIGSSSTTELGSQSGTEVTEGSGTQVTDASGTTVGNKSGSEYTNESGTEATNETGTAGTIAEGLRNVSVDQTVTGFEEVDQTINSIASSLSTSITDEQINSFVTNIQDITKDAKSSTEAWERLAGTSFGAMFGETFGVQPESGGGKVLCTLCYERGYISREMLNDDTVYAKRFAPETMVGYHFWAKPLVKWLRNRSESHIVFKLMKPLIIAWANEMSARMYGRGKANLLGKALIILGVPICNLIGHLVVVNYLPEQKGAI